ncbi:hypothetical protein EVAR_36052_1 [Eumeta japonica]|uniref:Uncharacterized protein n=1 Tax=Eumeta variegata TaxID=151549 RepID=A0A4C1WSY2_EUMVA|nr:hypothetical protein EVAR_36052_1 [Eumeta japonica]
MSTSRDCNHKKIKYGDDPSMLQLNWYLPHSKCHFRVSACQFQQHSTWIKMNTGIGFKDETETGLDRVGIEIEFPIDIRTDTEVGRYERRKNSFHVHVNITAD